MLGTRSLCLLALVPLLAQEHGSRVADALALREFRLELRARWEPLTDSTYGFEKEYALVRELAPAVERSHYGPEHFRPFLPPADAHEVGSTWSVDPRAVLPFLRQLHAGATEKLHIGASFGAEGTYACLRALGDAHAEIVLRAHADFLLAGDGSPMTSSWLTPAQFRGRIVIDRRRGEVVCFELALPASRANADLNVADEGNVYADIGRIPRIEVAGGSMPGYAQGIEQIDETEALARLEKRFYPFAAIGWLDLPAALAASRAGGKPLHVVALFGSLADESC